MKQIGISLTREEIRIIHQALNEICNGIHFEDSEFETRIGTNRDTAIEIMSRLETIYNSKSEEKK